MYKYIYIYGQVIGLISEINIKTATFYTILLFHRLVSTHPDSKLLFQDLSFELENGSIHDSPFITTHAKRLEGVVEAAINQLDDQQTIKDYVIELGKLHFTKYGVTHRLIRVIL